MAQSRVSTDHTHLGLEMRAARAFSLGEFKDRRSCSVRFLS
jgi:hypothetical protein